MTIGAPVVGRAGATTETAVVALPMARVLVVGPLMPLVAVGRSAATTAVSGVAVADGSAGSSLPGRGSAL